MPEFEHDGVSYRINWHTQSMVGVPVDRKQDEVRAEWIPFESKQGEALLAEFRATGKRCP